MNEPSTKNTYNIPGSTQEVVASANYEVERAYEAALEQAVGVSEINPDDIDRRRVEGMGASMVAAAEVVPSPTPEIYFNTSNPAELLNIGRGVTRFRSIELKGYDQADFDLAA